MQAVDGHRFIPKLLSEIEREHDLGELALAVRLHPVVGALEHHVVEVDRRLTCGAHVDDPGRRRADDQRDEPPGEQEVRQVVDGETQLMAVAALHPLPVAGQGGADPRDGERMESRDGHELRFAVNYLAHFLLTRRLVPLIISSAPARIVNVSSAGQAPIDFDDVMLERAYDGVQAYCQSKLAQVMLTFDLAEELRDESVTVNCLHPATYMPTKIVLHARGSAISTLE